MFYFRPNMPLYRIHKFVNDNEQSCWKMPQIPRCLCINYGSFLYTVPPYFLMYALCNGQALRQQPSLRNTWEKCKIEACECQDMRHINALEWGSGILWKQLNKKFSFLTLYCFWTNCVLLRRLRSLGSNFPDTMSEHSSWASRGPKSVSDGR